jgi:alpha-glucosidase (family GH31 glycosyl hydrolase)
MISGGNFTSFMAGAKIDQELIVRSAQCHALMPMMQFSAAPWRILSAENQQVVKAAVQLRQKYAPYILRMAKQTANTGIPIIRPLEFDFPNRGFANISNQFLLGDSLMVAPIVSKGSVTVEISLPQGKWKGFNGKIYAGEKKLVLPVTLNDLPYFEKI